MENPPVPFWSDINQFFASSSRQLVREIFEREAKKDSLVFLAKHLAGGKQGLKIIFEYGINHIPQSFPDSGDQEIAQYFFVVSELATLDHEVRSFALDASEYSKGLYDHDPWYRMFDPRKTYEEKIKPLLE